MNIMHYGMLIIVTICSHSMMAMKALKDMQGRVAEYEQDMAYKASGILGRIAEDIELCKNKFAGIKGNELLAGGATASLNSVTFYAKSSAEGLEKQLTDFKEKYPYAINQIKQITNNIGELKKEIESGSKTVQARMDKYKEEREAQERARKEEPKRKEANRYLETWVGMTSSASPTNQWLDIASKAEDKIETFKDPQIKKMYACAILNWERMGLDISNEEIKSKINYFEKFASIPERVSFAFDSWKDGKEYKEKQESAEKWLYLALAAKNKIDEIKRHKEAYLGSEAEDLKKEYARQALAIPGSANETVESFLQDVLKGTTGASAASTAPLSAEDQAIKQSVENAFEVWAHEAAGSANEKWNYVVGAASLSIGQLESKLDLASNQDPEKRKKILKKQLQIAETALALDRAGVDVTGELNKSLFEVITTYRDEALEGLQALQEK